MEFLWQEGHTAHATAAEAREETLQILDLYRDFAENVAAVPVYSGRKSASERFPGAIETFAIEALMPDGKALQVGHVARLRAEFCEGLRYQVHRCRRDDQTRLYDLVGRFVAHARRSDHDARRRPRAADSAENGADRSGSVPIVRSNDARAVEACETLAARLREAGFRVRVDARDEQPGWKYSEWDLRGVPVRIEIGPRDVDAQTGVLGAARPQQGEPGQRESVAIDRVPSVLGDLLDEIQQSLFAQAKAFLDEHTIAAHERDEFLELCKTRGGMIDIAWCERPDCEAHVKAATTATTRVLRDLDEPNLRCVGLWRAGESESLLCAILLESSRRAALAIHSASASRRRTRRASPISTRTARAVGNRRDVARADRRSIFATRWSAEVTQISANSARRPPDRRHPSVGRASSITR